MHYVFEMNVNSLLLFAIIPLNNLDRLLMGRLNPSSVCTLFIVRTLINNLDFVLNINNLDSVLNGHKIFLR